MGIRQDTGLGMKTRTFALLSIVAIALLAGCSSPETVDIDQLVERNGKHYRVNSEIPFTGTSVATYNGQKMLETNFKDGKLDGISTSWHENGQKWSEQTYKGGKADGIWTYWTEDGKKWSEQTYKDGELIKEELSQQQTESDVPVASSQDKGAKPGPPVNKEVVEEKVAIAINDYMRNFKAYRPNIDYLSERLSRIQDEFNGLTKQEAFYENRPQLVSLHTRCSELRKEFRGSRLILEESSIEYLPDPFIEMHFKVLELNQTICDLLLIYEELATTALECDEFLEPHKEFFADPLARIFSLAMEGKATTAISDSIKFSSEAHNKKIEAFAARFVTVSERMRQTGSEWLQQANELKEISKKLDEWQKKTLMNK